MEVGLFLPLSSMHSSEYPKATRQKVSHRCNADPWCRKQSPYLQIFTGTRYHNCSHTHNLILFPFEFSVLSLQNHPAPRSLSRPPSEKSGKNKKNSDFYILDTAMFHIQLFQLSGIHSDCRSFRQERLHIQTHRPTHQTRQVSDDNEPTRSGNLQRMPPDILLHMYFQKKQTHKKIAPLQYMPAFTSSLDNFRLKFGRLLIPAL